MNKFPTRSPSHQPILQVFSYRKLVHGPEVELIIDKIWGYCSTPQKAIQFIVTRMNYLLEYCWGTQLSLEEIKHQFQHLTRNQWELKRRVPGIDANREELGKIFGLSDKQLSQEFREVKPMLQSINQLSTNQLKHLHQLFLEVHSDYLKEVHDLSNEVQHCWHDVYPILDWGYPDPGSCLDLPGDQEESGSDSSTDESRLFPIRSTSQTN